MRTKTLLLTAALSLAGIASSMAQVFSANIVGYVNLSLSNNFNLIANPLNGSGGNNAISNVLTSGVLPNTQVFKFVNGSFSQSDVFLGPGVGWAAGGTMTASPGEGLFVSSPGATTVTFVGEVRTGSLTNAYPSGFSIVSSQVPQRGGIESVLGLTPAAGNNVQIFPFDVASQGYPISYVYAGVWIPSEPVLEVGQAVWLNATAGGNWVRTFNP